MQSILIRQARTEEFEAIGQLMVDVYSQLEGFPGPEQQPAYYHMLAHIGDWTTKPETELLVALTPDHQLAGGVLYFGDVQYYGSGGSATREVNASGFRLLAVGQQFRGKGIGKSLVEECIRKSNHRGSSSLILHTTESMPVAWKMYERLGFQRSPDLDFKQGHLQVYGFRFYH